MQDQNQPPAPRRTVNGRFRLLSQLAKGGMGVTFRAWDEACGRPAVVKIPKRALFDEPGFLERFDREVRATKALAHEHIVEVVDYGTDQGEPYLAMRFLPGGSLATRISRPHDGKRGRLPTAALHDWLPGIAAALDHAHANGIVHRDVKPANIFFDAHGSPSLGDFGIAKILEDSSADGADATLTGTNVSMGTHAYMAPERYIPKAAVDGRVDQYALAICTYEFLTGEKPFRGETTNIVVEHATMPPPDLLARRSDLPPSLCAAVRKALAKRPGDRFATCQAFADAVLADVAPAAGEAGYAWLQCPQCQRLLRMPASAGGRSGRCPHCRSELVIAQDLEGLWLPTEYSEAANDAAPIRIVEKNSGERRWLGPLRPWHGLALAGSLVAIVGLAMLSTAPREVPPTLPPADDQPASTTPAPTDADHAHPALALIEPPPPTEPVSERGATPPTPPAAPTDVDPPAMAASTQAPAPALPAEPPEPPEPAPSPAAEAAVREQAAWQERATRARDHFDGTVRWVLVDDPDNEADTVASLGSVSQPFYIAQYELTNADYCVYLNASKAGRDDWRGVGSRAIEPGAIIREKDAGSDIFDYRPAPGMAQKPVASLLPADALRLANWLHNLATALTDEIDTGAYDVGAEPQDGLNASRSPQAGFFVPTLDEWYKAAYFKRGTKKGGYWRYPTATNDPLLPRSSAPLKQGMPQGSEMTANFGKKSADAGVVDVGSSGAASAYGAFDMGGNAAEWAIEGRNQPPIPVACGGSWKSSLSSLARNALKTVGGIAQAEEVRVTGVRLARSIPKAGIQLTSDTPPRVNKGATFAALESLSDFLDEASEKVLDCPPQDLDAWVKTMEKGAPHTVDEKVRDEIAITLAVLTQAKTCCERKAAALQANQGLGMQLQFNLNQQNIGQLAQNLQAGIQAELKRTAILEGCNAELTELKGRLMATKQRLTDSIRPDLESRFGKP